MKKRRVDEVLLDAEKINMELVYDHGLQLGEILALTYVWAQIHAPASFECYNDGSGSPIFFYGNLNTLMVQYGLKRTKNETKK